MLRKDRRFFGFSLIELMVVIAIIAVLSATAAPLYKGYLIRAKIAKAHTFIEAVSKEAIIAYGQKGEWPATITIGPNTLNANAWTNIDYQDLASFLYSFIIGNGSVYGDGKGAVFGAIISGLEGIPNYETPTPGQQYPSSNTTGANTLYVGVREIDGVFKTVCGSWNNTAGQTPDPSYLPANCQCTDVQDFAMFGTGGC